MGEGERIGNDVKHGEEENVIEGEGECRDIGEVGSRGKQVFAV